MVEYKVEAFTLAMDELLKIEREAEVEETAALLSKFSFKVSLITARKLIYLGARET